MPRMLTRNCPRAAAPCCASLLHRPRPHPSSVPCRPASSAASGSARLLARAQPEGSGGGGGKDKDAGTPVGCVEFTVDGVRVGSGTSIAFLKICAGHPSAGRVLPLHIGEAESSALLKEINKTRSSRPLTHDLAKQLLQALGARVTKIRITELVNSTYHARIHIARGGSSDEIELDARPSDAINLAVRFGAPMFMSRLVAEKAEPYAQASSGLGLKQEGPAEVARSVKQLLASFQDPTTMLAISRELAVQDERYEDAAACQQRIWELVTHSTQMRLLVAMEAALADGRYEEAAAVRDEYRSLLGAAAVKAVADSAML